MNRPPLTFILNGVTETITYLGIDVYTALRELTNTKHSSYEEDNSIAMIIRQRDNPLFHRFMATAINPQLNPQVTILTQSGPGAAHLSRVQAGVKSRFY